jgi:hypothetical protein
LSQTSRALNVCGYCPVRLESRAEAFVGAAEG